MDDVYENALAVLMVFMGMLLLAAIPQGVREYRQGAKVEAKIARQTPILFWFGVSACAGSGISLIGMAIYLWVRQ